VSPISHVEDRWYTTDGGRKVRTARYDKGLRWRARYEDPDGKERSRSFAVKVMAEKFLTEVEHSKLSGSYRDPDAGRVSLRKYAEEWVKSYPEDSSRGEQVRRQLRLHILPGLGSMQLAQLSQRPSVIQKFLGGLPLSPAGASQVAITLSAVLAAACEDNLIVRNPCKSSSVTIPQQPRRKVVPWTSAQITALRGGLPEQWQAIADCGAGLGLRQGEIFGLGADSVIFLQRKVRVIRQVTQINGRLWFKLPKGDKERDVPLPGWVRLALAAHMKAHPPVEVTLPWNEPKNPKKHGKLVTARLLFVSRQGGAMMHSTFNTTAWRSARNAAGMPEGGPHQLRHFYASALLAGGVDIKALSEYLGHHDAAVTLKVYAHLMPSAEGRALRAIEEAFEEAENAGNEEADGPDTAQEGESAP
jgi:integrase